MFVNIRRATYIGRFVEGKEDLIEVFSRHKQRGFDRADIKPTLNGTKFKYHRVMPLKDANRVYDFRFEAEYRGSVFPMICVGEILDEYSYRFDTCFDEDRCGCGLSAVLLADKDSDASALGFRQESNTILSKVVGVDSLSKIYLIVYDYISNEEVKTEIPKSSLETYITQKYRLDF